MYKKWGTLGLFLEDYRLENLSRQGDALESLNKVQYWVCFHELLEKGIPKKFVQSGPKPYNPVQDHYPAVLL